MSARELTATRRAPSLGLAAAPGGRDRRATSDAAVYTAALYGAQGILFVAGLLQKGLLGPAGTGYWALMQTFWTLMLIFPLGAFQGASRQVPAYRGGDDYAAAAETADTGSSFSVAVLAVVGPALAVTALLFGSDWAPQMRYGLVLLGLLAPLRLFSNAHEVVIQATKRFNVAAAGEIVVALVVLVVQTTFVALFGFYGMFMGAVASIAALFILWNRKGLVSLRRPAFHWRIERSRLRELIGFGAPIMIHGQIWMLFTAVDSLIVAGFIDVRHLGYYSLAMSVTTYILLLPKSIGATLFPRMAERFGNTQDVVSLRHYATDVQRLLGYMLVPAFMAAAFFFLPVVIGYLLHEFEPGIAVVRIIVAGTFFMALMNMPVKLLITAGYRWRLTGLTSICLVANAALNYLAVGVLDTGIEGAAVATTVSYLVAFLVMTGYALDKVVDRREAFVQISALLAVFAYSVGVMWGLEALFPSGTGFVGQLILAAAKFACFLVALTPWLALAQRNYGGPAMLWSIVLDGARKLRALRSPA